MTKILLIISIFSFASLFQVNSCDKTGSATNNNAPIIEHNADKNASGKSVTITELNEQKQTKGVFETSGYVAKSYTCPACPPDSQCKPCMKSNIIISEEKVISESYEITDKELIIFTNNAKSFELGKEYKVTIKITDSKITSTKLNDIELIKAELVKE